MSALRFNQPPHKSLWQIIREQNPQAPPVAAAPAYPFKCNSPLTGSRRDRDHIGVIERLFTEAVDTGAQRTLQHHTPYERMKLIE